ncbi:MAG TPA: hypothetical protein VKH36_06400, partial [Acidimicrobiia bacterium]|nr:hypothetical protein [Acidimicrobiia bacterium]
MATKQIKALFAALGAGDTSGVTRLFPNTRTWLFHSGPAGEVVSSGKSTDVPFGRASGDQLARDYVRLGLPRRV